MTQLFNELKKELSKQLSEQIQAKTMEKFDGMESLMSGDPSIAGASLVLQFEQLKNEIYDMVYTTLIDNID